MAPFDHAYVYPGVPPLTVRLTDPVEAPLQPAGVALADALSAVGSLTVALAVCVHPLASVTVTLYDPDATPVRFCVVAPLLHKYV